MRRAAATRFCLAPLLACVGLLSVPALASASTAHAVVGGLELLYQAADGETNILTIDREGVSDPNAPDSTATRFEVADSPGSVLIQPQGDCRAPNGTTTPNYRVFCPVVGSLRLELGDGSDLLQGHTRDSPWHVIGGSGADSIEAGWANDRLFGGTANDLLDGDQGNDRLAGQAGKDVLDDDSGNNRIAGGAGNDVFVDGDGDSSLNGGAGRDRATDQGGADRIALGSGNDRIHAEDGVEERAINCGPGSRDKAILDRGDPRAANCENVSRG